MLAPSTRRDAVASPFVNNVAVGESPQPERLRIQVAALQRFFCSR
jgi:hypothetical protein